MNQEEVDQDVVDEVSEEVAYSRRIQAATLQTALRGLYVIWLSLRLASAYNHERQLRCAV